MKKLTFKEWINKHGTREIAKMLDVDPSAVRHWRDGFCYPTVKKMRIIKKITRGRIGYNQIIDGKR